MRNTKNTTILDFIEQVASSSATPGGGAVSALVASLGCALDSMLANLSIHTSEAMKQTAQMFLDKSQELLTYIDKDIEAFNGYMDALHMPKETEQQRVDRGCKLQEAAIVATEAPLGLGVKCYEVLTATEALVSVGNRQVVSDGKIAAILLTAAIKASAQNVCVNIPSIKDKALAERYGMQIKQLIRDSQAKEELILAL